MRLKSLHSDNNTPSSNGNGNDAFWIEKTQAGAKYGPRMRFSAITYSFCRSRCCLTRPLTYVSSRTDLLSCVVNEYHTRLASSCDGNFDYTAMAEVMKLFFGTDKIAFSTCSTTMLAGQNCNQPSQVVRSFSSFSQAAEENARSRVLVGIHFTKACNEGVEHGRKIAQHTFVHYLRPLR